MEEDVMRMHGEYHDALTRIGCVVDDRGWRSNRIAVDLGRYLATLLKKQLRQAVGIEYIAVGNGANGEDDFKSRVASFFQSKNLAVPFHTGSLWAWAKKIAPESIHYLDDSDQEITDGSYTNRLKIEIVFAKGEPSTETLVLTEFALLGIDEEGTPENLFFINYVTHGAVTKDQEMELTRTVKLSFPIGR